MRLQYKIAFFNQYNRIVAQFLLSNLIVKKANLLLTSGHMLNIRKFTAAASAGLVCLVSGLAFSGIATAAPIITHTDSFGVVYTLSSDGVNHGTAADPTYVLSVLADTTGFSASHGGTDFTNANAYINTITILALADPTNASTTFGPGDVSDPNLWVNVPGGQSSNGCNGNGGGFDCAYSIAGGNQPPTGPGVLMASTMTDPDNLGPGVLEWEFILHFAAGTTDPLSFDTDGSHLKVDYYGYVTHRHGGASYDFIGQISDDVTINDDDGGGGPGGSAPEPETLALLGLGLLAMTLISRRRATRVSSP